MNILTKDLKTSQQLNKYIIPGIIGLLFNSLYIVVDGLFVARILGEKSLAAVTVAVPIMEVLIALSMLISVGSGVLISKYNGQDDYLNSRKTFNIGFRVILSLGLIISLAGLLFLPKLSMALGATPDIFNQVVDYLKYLLIFTPGFMLNYGLGTWLRNDNNPKLAMVSQILGAITNIILDWVFMAPLNMGIKGASIATGLGPIVGILITLPHFILKKNNLYFEKINIFKELNRILEIIKKGLASFSMEFALGMTTFSMNIFIGKYLGSKGFAIFGIIGYLALLIFSLFLGMAEGSQPLVSYYDGKNNSTKKIEILSLTMLYSVFIGFVAYLGLISKGKFLIAIFAKGNRELIEASYKVVKLYFIGLSFVGLNIVISSYLQSIGLWLESSLISMFRSCLFLLPVLMILPKFFTSDYIWLAMPLAEFITLFVSLHFIRPQLGYIFKLAKN